MSNTRDQRFRIHTVYLELREHHDGCVILSGSAANQWESVELYEKYFKGAPFAPILRQLAHMLEGIEEGKTSNEAMWTELQLPLDGV